jgi:hypothetical protein
MSNTIPTTINNDNELNKDNCNAFECFNKATEKIEVKAGKFGIISLNLCSACIEKFQ